MTGTDRPFPRIEARRLVPGGGLAADALAGRGEAPGLYASPPGVLPSAPGPRVPLIGGEPLPAEVFTVTSSRAAERLDAVLAGEGVVVSAGQQPGLFLGPLYSLYKALTAVRIAAEIEARSGQPALATFWVASDDHDWDEVAACRFIDANENLVTLRLDPPDGHADRSVGSAPLPGEVTRLLERFQAETGGAVAGTPPSWVDALRNAYRPGRTFGEAFVEALAAATAETDLAILDSAHSAVRERASHLYGRFADRPEIVIEAMSEGRTRLQAADYEPPLTPPAEGLQVFYDDGRARRHVLRRGDAFSIDADEPLSRDELLCLLRERPDAFTPAAALRPVLESALLPVAATVLGPGELTYWAQLRPLFEALEVPMPAVSRRDAWVLIEPRIDRLLEKLDLDVATVEAEGPGIDDRWIRRHRPPAVRAALSDLEEALDGGIAALEAAVDSELPGILSAAGKAEHRLRKSLEELSRTVDARVRERESIALGQAARVRVHLTPGGDPQERVVAAAQFLARHGRGLVRDLLAASRVAASREQD